MSGRIPNRHNHRAKKLSFETLEERQVLSAATISVAPEPLASAAVLEVVAPSPTAWLVEEIDIPTLPWQRFNELTPAQIPLLTPLQIASIPNVGAFSTISAECRAALTPLQVQSLQVATVRLTLLTPQQINWLTVPQIQSIFYYDFKYLSASQVPSLTTGQISSVAHDYTFRGEFNDDQRDALTQAQIQAIAVNADKVRIDWMSAQQVAWLKTSQIQAVIASDFHVLAASQIPTLTPAQIATVANDFTYRVQFSLAQRAALSRPQVQALQVGQTRIDWLSDTQAAWLTVAQIQQVLPAEFYVLNSSQTPSLTMSQIQQVGDVYTFEIWGEAARHALTQSQVQALRVHLIQLDQLSPTQVGWLTPAQVQTVLARDYWYLPPSQVPHLSIAQIAAIPDPGLFMNWTPTALAALTAPQVQALSLPGVRIDILTPLQRSYLTLSQIHKLPVGDFYLLNPNQIPLLSAAQIDSITGPAHMSMWTPEHRSALTVAQVQSMHVGQIGLANFSDLQVSWLTTAQIQSLSVLDLPRLAPEQIPLISPAQFAQMPNMFVLSGFSDEVRSKLTREQLMALPFDVLSTYMSVEVTQFPPTGMTGHPIATDVFNLARTEDATHVTVASGDWSNPAIWRDRVVPGAGARVAIVAGHTVRFDAVMTQAIKTLRIDGTLSFAADRDTTLRVDTIVVYATGKLHIGVDGAPIQSNVTARVIVPNTGPIDTAWDPNLLSRGLLSRGQVRMVGRTVTPYATLVADPLAGDRTLQLTAAPTGWRVGDELQIAGVNPVASDFGSERVRIAAINGVTVTLDRALSYNHDAPDGYGFSIQVANLNRNIQFLAEDSSVIAQRPHIMFFGSADVKVENVLIDGYGRTDKSEPINDPIVVGGVLQPGTGTNARARYPLHFHHTGVDPAVAPGIVRGNVVLGGPGWGYVNHQSNVVMEDNVAIGVVGASFTSEDGNEIGAMRRNLTMNTVGSGDFILSRKAIHDWGHGGHGFWLQGPGVEVVDNIVSGAQGGAFAYMTASSMALFESVNLVDPSIAVGHEAIPVGVPPLRSFRGNTAYASNIGLEIWFHRTNLNDGNTVIEDFTSWNTEMFGIQIQYAGHITIRNSTLVGRLDAVSGYGIVTNRLTHDVTLQNVIVKGFGVGMYVAPRRATVVDGGQFANVQNFVIAKGHDTLRSVLITASVKFVPLTAAQINGRPTWNVAVNEALAMKDNLDRRISSFFDQDDIRVERSDGSVLRFYFAEQAASAIPFVTASTAPAFPVEYVGKTNAQLQQNYGVWYNGGNLPAGTFTPAGMVGLATVSSGTHDADFNSDGAADGTDFLTWQRGFATPNAVKSKGDADGDADVDGGDLAVWWSSFGASAIAAASGSKFAAANLSYQDNRNAALSPELIDAAMAYEQMTAGQKASDLKRRPFYRPL
ncbi:MAG: right-handed parallel beta-helix repeat-containing protein [Pirellulales bacterium]|nr:right-handed parallel beta-helix repeat-containing protein [Pirellulales bacterium]